MFWSFSPLNPTEIRLVPPGRLIHLARYSGARRAWWVQRSHPVPQGTQGEGEER